MHRNTCLAVSTKLFPTLSTISPYCHMKSIILKKFIELSRFELFLRDANTQAFVDFMVHLSKSVWNHADY